MTTIAALGAEGIISSRVPIVRPVTWERVENAASLFEAMRRRQIDVLHVHASALDRLGLPHELKPATQGKRRAPHPFTAGVMFDGKSLSTNALAPSIEAAGMEIMIGAYQDGAGDLFDAAADATELLFAHLRFSGSLENGAARPWYFRQSAAQTGWKLMHAPWAYGTRAARLARMDFEANPRPVLHGVPEGGQVEIPYGSWMRPRDAPASGLPWVTAWDVNGQRLSACSRLPLGISGLQEIEAPDEFDPKMPGYHFVSKVDDPFDGWLPPIFKPGWHTTPRVAMAEYLGLDFTIDRSHVWTNSVAYLDPWYSRLRDARERLLLKIAGEEQGARIALDALKQCYLQPLGRLRSIKARERGDKYFRPHWYDSVIGQELAREYLRLHALAMDGVVVLAVYFDTIFVEAPDFDPPAALPVSGQLGKYKFVGAFGARAARSILYDEQGGVAKLHAAIKTDGSIGGVNG